MTRKTGDFVAQQEDQHVEDFARTALKIYGTAVVEDRAVPDYRDGLKPVHRAILWSMYDLGLQYNKGFKKAARTIGDVIGRFHPRGDSAAYGAMVTIANTTPNLVDGSGNWGTVTDAAAAMRYCFVKGTRVSTERGLLKIEDMANTDKDLSTTDNARSSIYPYVSSLDKPVRASSWVNSGRHQVATITTTSGRTCTCTLNQPFYVQHRNRFTYDYKWVTVSDLKVGQSICIKTQHHVKVDKCGQLPVNTVIPSTLQGMTFLPDRYSEELAYIIGTVTNRVISEDNVTQKNFGLDLCPEVMVKFAQCWDKVFRGSQDVMRLTEEDAVLEREVVYFFLGELGVFDNDHVPEVVFRSSREEACAYLSGLFDNNLQTLIRVTPVSLTYIACPSFHADLRALLVPHSIVYYQYGQGKEGIIKRPEDISYLYINISMVNTAQMDIYAAYLDVTRVLSRTKSSVWQRLGNYLQDVTYLQEDIINIHIHTEKEWVYDITVPDTHAFVANGCVVHNTEARLSEFSCKFLLDPNYLAVTPMVKNFSNDMDMPVFLPAKLPVQLLIGSPTVPAYGVSAGTPPFHIAGVVKVMRLSLTRDITVKDCLRHLHPCFSYGGNCISDKTEKAHLYKTGKGSLTYMPDIVVDVHRKNIKIMSNSPGFASQATIETKIGKICDLKAVKTVKDESGNNVGNYNVCYHVVTSRGVSQDAFADLVDSVNRIMTTKDSYDIGYTLRKKSGSADFGRLSVVDFFNQWIKFRIKLEVAVINNLLKKQHAEVERLRRLVFAVDHIDDITDSLKTKDPHQYLIDLWDKDRQTVTFILNLVIIRLARMEKVKLHAKIKDAGVIIATLNKDKLCPEDRVQAQIKNDILPYIRKTVNTK